MTALPRIVYIAGYGRSGSTLLNRLLGQQPDICGAGELARITDWIESPRPCGCGELIAECDFWTRVRRRLPASAKAGHGWQTAIESAIALAVGYWWIPVREREKYRDLQRRLFGAIGEADGASIVVDSSKSALRIAGRANALRVIAQLDVLVVHLVRNPHAVLESLRKGTNKELEGRRDGPRKFRRARAFLGWSLANWAALRFAGRLPQGSALRVDYEELVSDAQPILTDVGRMLGRPVDRIRAVLDGRESERIQHVAEGNRMRRDSLQLIAAAPPSPSFLDLALCTLLCGLTCRRLGLRMSGRR